MVIGPQGEIIRIHKSKGTHLGRRVTRQPRPVSSPLHPPYPGPAPPLPPPGGYVPGYPPGYRPNAPTAAPKFGVDASEMEGVDIFYNVILDDRIKPHLSGGSYYLLQHPFERFQPKPRIIPQEKSAIIEVVIRAMNISFSPFFQAPTPKESDDDKTDSENESQEANSKTGDTQPDLPESEVEQKTSWQLNQESFAKRLENYQLESYKVYSLVIHSPHLQDLLRSVITYYPSFNLKGSKIEVQHPFEPLMHYYNDLAALKMSGESDKKEEKISLGNKNPSVEINQTQYKALDKDTLHALDVLLGYLTPTYLSTFQPEQSRYQEGFASYDLLWMLFKPGTDVYARVDGKFAAFVVEEFFESESRGRANSIINCWSLAYRSRRVMKVKSQFTIYEYMGEKEIMSLPVFPCTYLHKTDKGKTKASIEALGAKYYEILKQVPTFRAYYGQAWSKKKKGSKSKKGFEERVYMNDGQIIVDPRGYLLPIEKDSDSDSGSDTDSDSDQSSVASDEEGRNDDLASGVDQSPFADIIIDPKTHPSLTEHQYFLLPRRIKGFDLKAKKWMYFDIELIGDIYWSPDGDDPMSKLILGSTDIDILKALSRAHGDTAPVVWSADFIPGKGEGQIFLLHECVADFTRRPLLSLTVADIGTDEQTMENNLHRWFEMAASWDAIILIDEADVFLEKRTVADLQRNSLVSVFLRCMEYYTGMLFLTTNRIGHIDDAFLSRMSVALTYDTLDNTKQKLIWRGFLAKLRKERKDISLTGRAETYLETLHLNDDTKNIPWNGREIRNALQIAIALATHDAAEEAKESGEKITKIRVEKDHFEKVIDRRKAFIKYRDSIRNKNEDQRAYVEGNRALVAKET